MLDVVEGVMEGVVVEVTVELVEWEAALQIFLLVHPSKQDSVLVANNSISGSE